MYRMPVIIVKISPDGANRTPTRSGGVLLRPVDNDQQRSIHYPAYYTATYQNEKVNTRCVFLQFICKAFVVLISGDVVGQRG